MHFPSDHPADRLIVALDFPSRSAALDLVDRLEGQCRWFKVGLELFLAEGPAVVESLRQRDLNVFLDLKLHDIPNTVAAAVRSVCSLGASLLTVHAAGGPAMLQAAQEIAGPQSMRLLAVTVLTSMDERQLHSTGTPGSTAEQVHRLGKMARDAGIAGLVCSAEEITLLRAELGAQTLLVVPGIRPQAAHWSAVEDDQHRIATPARAIEDGASMLVVGRPITRAAEPAAAASAILQQMANPEWKRESR